MHIYIYIHTHTHIYVYICIHILTNVYIYICIYIYICLYLHIYIRACQIRHIYVFMLRRAVKCCAACCMCVRVYIYVCTSIYIIYMCTYCVEWSRDHSARNINTHLLQHAATTFGSAHNDHRRSSAYSRQRDATHCNTLQHAATT